MTVKQYMVGGALLLLLVLIGLSAMLFTHTGPELSQTASGTWMSPREQGTKEVVLTTTNVQEGASLMAVTLLDVTFGYLPKGELLVRPDASGKQIVRLGVKVANIGTQDANFRYDQIVVRLKNGTQGMLSFYVNQSNARDFLQSKQLAAGDSVEGAIYVELPASAVRGDLLVEFQGEKSTTPLALIP
ncbi:hypothetical protein COW46_02530 [Candidatus Gracilibacteria bacterium CG17_big_fil_post_rev_8_21_14_2_50_48_13]|nr:MAG: hypothetical protein COW46_02530 [Candidatus Gracilibacteria bacterium CG17_big_fil_post_rev_8_21_14_2_50_48_13]